MNTFGQILKELRAEKKITQKELSKILGVSTTCYAGYEQGNHEPAFFVLAKLAAFFNVSVDYLLGLNDDYDAPKRPAVVPMHAPAPLKKDENELLSNFRALSLAGKARISAYADLLREQEEETPKQAKK